MAISPFVAAINQISDEKGLPREMVIEAVEAALAAAYRKDYGHPDDVIRAELSDESEDVLMNQVYVVVEDEALENERSEMTLAAAKEHNPEAQIGDEIIFPLESHK